MSTSPRGTPCVAVCARIVGCLAVAWRKRAGKKEGVVVLSCSSSGCFQPHHCAQTLTHPVTAAVPVEHQHWHTTYRERLYSPATAKCAGLSCTKLVLRVLVRSQDCLGVRHGVWFCGSGFKTTMRAMRKDRSHTRMHTAVGCTIDTTQQFANRFSTAVRLLRDERGCQYQMMRYRIEALDETGGRRLCVVLQIVCYDAGLLKIGSRGCGSSATRRLDTCVFQGIKGDISVFRGLLSIRLLFAPLGLQLASACSSFWTCLRYRRCPDPAFCRSRHTHGNNI